MTTDATPPGPAAPDIPAILSTLSRRRAAVVVIGGVAVAHHGYVRATKDVDIVPRPDPENLVRLWEALVELEARPLEATDCKVEEPPAPFDRDALLQLGNWAVSTRHGRLDILQYIAGKLETVEDYEALARDADEAHFTFGTVLFASYRDLVDFKNLAGRDQDLIDIRALREARGETGPVD